jgi:hypothetical protein
MGLPPRYTVLEVHEGPAEKVLRALDEVRGHELAVHLRDGWAGTPAQTGDTVHVLAHVDTVDGQAHAVCDHSKGDDAGDVLLPAKSWTAHIICLFMQRVGSPTAALRHDM